MCLCSLLPPSNHQAPRTQQSTHDLQGIIPVRLLIIASSCILRRDTFTSSVKIPYICTCAEISSETNDCEYSRFLHIPPVVYSGCWAGTWRRQLVVAFEAVASGKEGVCFGQVGGNVGQSGAVDRFSICGGSYLRHLWSKGGIGSPPPALRGPVRPKNVHGVRARHGLRESYQRFGIEFEEGWGTWERLSCARFPYTLNWSTFCSYQLVIIGHHSCTRAHSSKPCLRCESHFCRLWFGPRVTRIDPSPSRAC